MNTPPSKKPERRRLWIDTAPGLEHLPALLAGNPAPLSAYYRVRVKAHPHRLIHDRLITYGIFWDLERQLAPESARSLIPAAVQIVLEEPRSTRICAFSLLAGLCERALDAPAPFPALPHADELRPLAEELTLETEIHHPWAEIMFYHMLAQDLPTAALPAMQLDREGWKNHFPESIPEIPEGSEVTSPMDWMTLLRRCGFRVDARTERPKFLRTAVLESTHYWCWFFSTPNAFDAHQYLIVSQHAGQGDAAAHKIHLFRPQNPPLAISLLRWHYLALKS